MWIDELSTTIHGAETVGIAVRSQAELAMAGGDCAGKRAEVVPNRFRMNAAETGVHLSANLKHLTTCALQYAAYLPSAGSEHRINDDVLWIICDFVEVDELSQVVIIGRGGVYTFDQAFGASLIEIH